jgi:hypothetical protein
MADLVVETWPPEPLVTERLVLRDQPSVRIDADQLNGLMGQYYELDPATDQFAAASFAFTCNDRGWPRGAVPYWSDLKKDSKAEPIFAANIPAVRFIGRTAPPSRS